MHNIWDYVIWRDLLDCQVKNDKNDDEKNLLWTQATLDNSNDLVMNQYYMLTIVDGMYHIEHEMLWWGWGDIILFHHKQT